MPRLLFLEEGRELFVHLLRPGRTVIGRSDRCDLALPSGSVSRIHCVIEQRPEGWWLLDRSKNGTRVNDRAVERHLLQEGDAIDFGTVTARFSGGSDNEREAPTAGAVKAAVHEEIVAVDDDGVALQRAELRFTRGPHEERVIVLHRPRPSIGGPGSDIILDDVLPRHAVRVRVVRGRVMIEPNGFPVFLGDVRVRELTPAFVGEEVRVGDHTFSVSVTTVHDHTEELTAFGQLVGSARPMRRLFGTLARMAAHDDPVLVTGESGTGKELAARALHDGGPRCEGPFVAVNCAAIAETLFESELFGHEKGAFTGATNRQDGAFQQAHQGTLFLDEIGELKSDMQAKLLRALESGEVRRVGGQVCEYPDVRVVAATNRNLPEMVRSGQFREDLYFRLAVLTVRMPPLRERKEDLRLLARTLLARSHPGATLTDDAVAALESYDWPGNVRELRNVLTRAYVMGGRVVSAEGLQFHPWAFEGEPRTVWTVQTNEDPERKMIVSALHRAGGNRARAARELGLARSTLLYKMRRFGIDVA